MEPPFVTLRDFKLFDCLFDRRVGISGLHSADHGRTSGELHLY